MILPTNHWVELQRPLLPDGLYYDNDGGLYFHCNVCDAPTEWPVEPEDFEFGVAENVCGGSPWCCP